MCFLKKIHCLRLEKYFSRSAFLIKKSLTFQGLILLFTPKGEVTVVFLPSFFSVAVSRFFCLFPLSPDRTAAEIDGNGDTRYVLKMEPNLSLFPIRAPQQRNPEEWAESEDENRLGKIGVRKGRKGGGGFPPPQ